MGRFGNKGGIKEFMTEEQAGCDPIRFAYPARSGGIVGGVSVSFNGVGGGVVSEKEIGQLHSFLTIYLTRHIKLKDRKRKETERR